MPQKKFKGDKVPLNQQDKNKNSSAQNSSITNNNNNNNNQKNRSPNNNNQNDRSIKGDNTKKQNSKIIESTDIFFIKKEVYGGCSIQFQKNSAEIQKLSTPELSSKIEEVLNRYLKEWTSGAIWFELSQEAFISFGKILLDKKFKFHRCNPTNQNFVYYYWNKTGIDRVPAAATSVEGASCFLLSRDKKKILTVSDRSGKIGLPGGAVDMKELAWEAALRELKEETGLSGQQLPIGLLRIGGHNTKSARHGGINDNYSVWVFMLDADCDPEKDLKIDPVEISSANWFNVIDVAEGKIKNVRPNVVFWVNSYLDHYQYYKKSNTTILENKTNRIVFG